MAPLKSSDHNTVFRGLTELTDSTRVPPVWVTFIHTRRATAGNAPLSDPTAPTRCAVAGHPRGRTLSLRPSPTPRTYTIRAVVHSCTHPARTSNRCSARCPPLPPWKVAKPAGQWCSYCPRTLCANGPPGLSLTYRAGLYLSIIPSTTQNMTRPCLHALHARPTHPPTTFRGPTQPASHERSRSQRRTAPSCWAASKHHHRAILPRGTMVPRVPRACGPPPPPRPCVPHACSPAPLIPWPVATNPRAPPTRHHGQRSHRTTAPRQGQPFTSHAQ